MTRHAEVGCDMTGHGEKTTNDGQERWKGSFLAHPSSSTKMHTVVLTMKTGYCCCCCFVLVLERATKLPA